MTVWLYIILKKQLDKSLRRRYTSCNFEKLQIVTDDYRTVTFQPERRFLCRKVKGDTNL